MYNIEETVYPQLLDDNSLKKLNTASLNEKSKIFLEALVYEEYLDSTCVWRNKLLL